MTKGIQAIDSPYPFCFTPCLPANGNYFAYFLITIRLMARTSFNRLKADDTTFHFL